MFLQIVSIIMLSALGGAVWLQRTDSKVHQRFLIFTLLFSLWIATGIVSNIETSAALMMNRFVFVPPLLLVWSAMSLVVEISGKSSKVSKFVAGAIMVASIVTLTTGAVVDQVVARYGAGGLVGYDFDRNIGYYLYVALLLVVSSIVLSMVYARRHINPKQKRAQMSIIGIGFICSLATGVVVAVVLPVLLGSSAPSEYSFISVAIVAVFFAYAIVRHSLFDIKLVAVRGVAYGGSLLVLSVVYYVSAYVVTTLFFGGNTTSQVSVSPVNIALALLLTLLFQPVKHQFDKLTDKIFYRSAYNTNDFYAEVGRILMSTTDLRTLLERSAKYVGDNLKSAHAQFYVYYRDESDRFMSAGTKNRPNMAIRDVRALDEFVTEYGKPFVMTDDLASEHRSVRRMLVSYDVAVVMPLWRENMLVGYLLLGDCNSGAYKKRDFTALSTIENEHIIAIQNALSLQEVKDLNSTLQQRIDAATKELRSSNAQLKHLDEVKDEFMSMASHQLRTPLTSVKGYLSMVLDGDAGSVTWKQRKLLMEAFKSSERMVGLIGDFLNVSRLQTGKFIIEKTPFDFGAVVRQEVDDLKLMATSHDIKLALEYDGKPIPVLADEAKVRQVMMNMIDNAVFYSQPGTAVSIRVKYMKSVGKVEFTVVDTGIGVPADEQKRLFQKFFRAKNARQQRPDGTGVGLYLARRVVTAHAGSIVFASKENKGSTFGFRLPVDQRAGAKLNTTPEQLAQKAKVAAG